MQSKYSFRVFRQSWTRHGSRAPWTGRSCNRYIPQFLSATSSFPAAAMSKRGMNPLPKIHVHLLFYAPRQTVECCWRAGHWRRQQFYVIRFEFLEKVYDLKRMTFSEEAMFGCQRHVGMKLVKLEARHVNAPLTSRTFSSNVRAVVP